jgi:hypothetical protein
MVNKLYTFETSLIAGVSGTITLNNREIHPRDEELHRTISNLMPIIRGQGPQKKNSAPAAAATNPI